MAADRASARRACGVTEMPDRHDPKRANPDRPARIATQSFRACRVGLPRPAGPATPELPARVDVHLAEELERNPPTGQELVRWVLVTSAHALLNLLVLTSQVATDLLLLRHLADEQPDTPAGRVRSELDLAVLDLAVANRMELPNDPTMLQVPSAIAALGGHLERSSPPGWITLMRGDVELRRLVEGARCGVALAGESITDQASRRSAPPPTSRGAAAPPGQGARSRPL